MSPLKRTYDEAEAYCESIGLEVHTTQVGDECLLTYLKLWAQRITINFIDLSDLSLK